MPTCLKAEPQPLELWLAAVPAAAAGLFFFPWDLDRHTGLLVCAIGIQEGTGQINDRFAAPAQHQPRFICHNSDTYSFQILFPGICQKCFFVFWVQHYGHTFL